MREAESAAEAVSFFEDTVHAASVLVRPPTVLPAPARADLGYFFVCFR